MLTKLQNEGSSENVLNLQPKLKQLTRRVTDQRCGPSLSPNPVLVVEEVLHWCIVTARAISRGSSEETTHKRGFKGRGPETGLITGFLW